MKANTMAKLNIMTMSAADRDAHNAAQLAKLTNVPVPAVAFHNEVLKGWQAKFSGPKPTAEQLKMNYVIAADRRAGIEVTWFAMTLRANGATVGEYMRATNAGGAAHNNAKKLNEKGAGWFVRVPLPNDGRDGRWQHVITEKGIAQLDKRIAQIMAAASITAQPAKAAVKAKPVKAKAPKKAKAKPVPAAAVVTAADNATAEPATVQPTAEPATSEALSALQAHFNQ